MHPFCFNLKYNHDQSNQLPYLRLTCAMHDHTCAQAGRTCASIVQAQYDYC